MSFSWTSVIVAVVLTLVWQDTGNRLYETRVRETIDWVLREMIADSGAFAATLDADFPASARLAIAVRGIDT